MNNINKILISIDCNNFTTNISTNFGNFNYRFWNNKNDIKIYIRYIHVFYYLYILQGFHYNAQQIFA